MNRQFASFFQLFLNQRNLAATSYQQNHFRFQLNRNPPHQLLHPLRSSLYILLNKFIELSASKRNRRTCTQGITETQLESLLGAENFLGPADMRHLHHWVKVSNPFIHKLSFDIAPESLIKFFTAYIRVTICQVSMGTNLTVTARHQGKIQRTAPPVNHQGASGTCLRSIHAAIGQAGSLRLRNELYLHKTGSHSGSLQFATLCGGEPNRTSDGCLCHLFTMVYQFLCLFANVLQELLHQRLCGQLPDIPPGIPIHMNGGIRTQLHFKSTHVATSFFLYHIIRIITKEEITIGVNIGGGRDMVSFTPQFQRFRLPRPGIHMAHQGFGVAEINTYSMHVGKLFEVLFGRPYHDAIFQAFRLVFVLYSG